MIYKSLHLELGADASIHCIAEKRNSRKLNFRYWAFSETRRPEGTKRAGVEDSSSSPTSPKTAARCPRYLQLPEGRPPHLSHYYSYYLGRREGLLTGLIVFVAECH